MTKARVATLDAYDEKTDATAANTRVNAAEITGFEAAPALLWTEPYLAAHETLARNKWTILGEIARVAGVPTPIHEAFVTLFGTLLGADFRREGITLDKLGLGGCTKAELLAYVAHGHR